MVPYKHAPYDTILYGFYLLQLEINKESPVHNFCGKIFDAQRNDRFTLHVLEFYGRAHTEREEKFTIVAVFRPDLAPAHSL